MYNKESSKKSLIPTLKLKESQFTGLYHSAIARRNKKKYKDKINKKSNKAANNDNAPPYMASLSSKFSLSKYFSFATSNTIHPTSTESNLSKVNVLVIDSNMESNSFFVKELVEKPRYSLDAPTYPLLNARSFSLSSRKDENQQQGLGDMNINSAGRFGNGASIAASEKQRHPAPYVFANAG